MNKVIGESNNNDRMVVVIIDKGNERCVKSVALSFMNKYGQIIQAHGGDMFSESYVDPEHLTVMRERGRYAYVGDRVRGGLGIDGNIEIKYRPEILNFCSPYLPEFSNPDIWPLLRKLAESDLKANKTDYEK